MTDTASARRLCGRMILELYQEPGERPVLVPKVTNLGLLSPNIIERSLTEIYKAIQRAQVTERVKAANKD